jgi:hypothetical protein
MPATVDSVRSSWLGALIDPASTSAGTDAAMRTSASQR